MRGSLSAGVDLYAIRFRRVNGGAVEYGIDDGGSDGGWESWADAPSTITIGTVSADADGKSEFPPPPYTPARVDGVSGCITRWRVKFYNLSHLGD